ncbi:MAG: hypothetical protein R2762_04725 [Bryobacteraceae bacterium]
MAASPVLSAALLASARPLHLPLIAPVGLAFPRGRISEIHGAPSSGRTSLLFNALAQATAQEGDLCALVDSTDAFDPDSAAAGGVQLNRLLWIRCEQAQGRAPLVAGGRFVRPLEKAFRAVDLLLQANGFGVVVLDMADVDARAADRVPLNYWYRFRRAVEQTRTALLVITEKPQARQCAAFSVEAQRRGEEWSGVAGCSRTLDGVELHFEPRKPPGSARASMPARMPIAAGG